MLEELNNKLKKKRHFSCGKKQLVNKSSRCSSDSNTRFCDAIIIYSAILISISSKGGSTGIVGEALPKGCPQYRTAEEQGSCSQSCTLSQYSPLRTPHTELVFSLQLSPRSPAALFRVILWCWRWDGQVHRRLNRCKVLPGPSVFLPDCCGGSRWGPICCTQFSSVLIDLNERFWTWQWHLYQITSEKQFIPPSPCGDVVSTHGSALSAFLLISWLDLLVFGDRWRMSGFRSVSSLSAQTMERLTLTHKHILSRWSVCASQSRASRDNGSITTDCENSNEKCGLLQEPCGLYLRADQGEWGWRCYLREMDILDCGCPD